MAVFFDTERPEVVLDQIRAAVLNKRIHSRSEIGHSVTVRLIDDCTCKVPRLKLCCNNFPDEDTTVYSISKKIVDCIFYLAVCPVSALHIEIEIKDRVLVVFGDRTNCVYDSGNVVISRTEHIRDECK